MPNQHWWLRSIAVLLIGCIALGFSVQSIEQKEPQYNIISARKIDSDGKVHHLGIENKKASPVALVFLEVGCVISQRLIPELNNIYLESQKEGVRFYGVISNSKASWQEAQKFKAEFDIQFPLIFDANGDLAHQIKPTVVPESFLFDIYDQLRYHGRINDQFADVGKINRNPRHNDLLDAIKAVAQGKKVAVPHQIAKGCIFQPWPTENRAISYNKDIEPILRANCASCHKPNDIGPFSLLTYDEVARRAGMVEFVTRKRYMPIWKAEKGYGKFANEHSLTDYEINLIGQWVKSGLAEGETKDLLPPQEFASGEWKLGEPDLILEMEPYNLPAEGDDQYRVFVMQGKIPKGKVIQAIDFKAGDPAVVHHSTIFVDYTGKLRQYDEEDPKPGYDAFEKGGTMEFGSAVSVCGWAPGLGPYSYPEGVGFYVEQDAEVAFENHYHLYGKATTDKSYIGIYYAKEPVKKYITGSIIGTQKLQIPANTTSFKKSVWAYVPADIELYDLTPHMHYIGQSVNVEVQFPDGRTQSLLKLDNWDLRWQSVYTLRELMLIPKGSIIKADFEYDNSDDNADNPNYPAEEIYWGWGSSDEMCEVYFSYVPLDPADYGKMIVSSLASFEHFYPLSERIELNEQNLAAIKDQFAQCDIWSEEGQKLLYSIIESRLGDQLLALLDKEWNRYKENPNFLVNRTELALTEAYFSFDEKRMINEASKGGDQLYEVLGSGSEHWNAHMSYARIMLDSGIEQYEKEGLRILQDLISTQEKLNPEAKFAIAYWELGKYYYAQGKDAKAEAILKQGLSYHPENADLQQELASDGRIIKKTLN